MKTIRQNTFETNSSSTHAVSFSSTLNNPPSFIPVNNGHVTILIDVRDEETWKNKAGLLGFITEFSKESPITTSKLQDILSEYCGFLITLDSSHQTDRLNKALTAERWKRTENEWFDETLCDSYFVRADYTFSSSEELTTTICNILADEEKIKRFCFSESIYNVESYYDG